VRSIFRSFGSGADAGSVAPIDGLLLLLRREARSMKARSAYG
jgi:hypothetical protein